jgi:hypothetical protein
VMGKHAGRGKGGKNVKDVIERKGIETGMV